MEGARYDVRVLQFLEKLLVTNAHRVQHGELF